MCGLSGVLIGPGAGGNAVEEIKDLFTAGLLANEERGREATGVAVLNADGTYSIEKSPVTASRFVKEPKFLEFLDQAITPMTTVLLGHNRRPTKGTPLNNLNNHPILVGNTIGMHNGIITNDDEIFLSMERRKDKRRKRISSVDSEAIFSLVEDVDPGQSLDEYAAGIQSVVSLLVGSYTALFVNTRMPHLLFMLKYQNPISVHYEARINALFFSSRYVFLRKAFGRSVITKALPGRRGYVFDARSLEQLGKESFLNFQIREQEKIVSWKQEESVGIGAGSGSVAGAQSPGEDFGKTTIEQKLD